MRLGLFAFLAAVVLPLTACGSASDEEWAGPPQADSAGIVAVGDFNDYLAGNGEYARSPIIATTRFLRLDRLSPGTTSILARTSGEGAGPTVVTVTLDRLADDSVRAQRYVLTFTREGEEWRLDSARVTQRCWPGRGHQSFTTEPCV